MMVIHITPLSPISKAIFIGSLTGKSKPGPDLPKTSCFKFSSWATTQNIKQALTAPCTRLSQVCIAPPKGYRNHRIDNPQNEQNGLHVTLSIVHHFKLRRKNSAEIKI